MQTYGSNKMKVGMSNLNNATYSISSKSSDAEDYSEMKDVSEYVLALRTMRVSAPWRTTCSTSNTAKRS
jgi:hypothetical protein